MIIAQCFFTQNIIIVSYIHKMQSLEIMING